VFFKNVDGSNNPDGYTQYSVVTIKETCPETQLTFVEWSTQVTGTVIDYIVKINGICFCSDAPSGSHSSKVWMSCIALANLPLAALCANHYWYCASPPSLCGHLSRYDY
jgi:hypothetical protein